MVFVFQKSAYGSGSKQSPWKQRRIMLGLFLSVVAYVLVGAGMFMWINPEFSSQGSDDKFETTFRDAVYFATVTITTVGYGDVVPSSDGGKIFISAYILLSLVLVGVALDLTDFLFTIEIDDIEQSDSELERSRRIPPSLRRLLWSILWVFVLICASVIFFTLREDLTVVDAIYFSIVSLSTVGYGDISITSNEGQVFGTFWVGIGVLALFQCVGALMNFMLERRKARWIEERESRNAALKTHLSARVGIIALKNVSNTQALRNYTKQDLLEVLTKMEFIMIRLEREGKVSQRDYRDLDQQFKAMTLDAINDEFNSPETSQVMASITGNVEA